MEQSVPKRRHIKFRRLGITQKKTYNSSKFNEVPNLRIILNTNFAENGKLFFRM